MLKQLSCDCPTNHCVFCLVAMSFSTTLAWGSPMRSRRSDIRSAPQPSSLLPHCEEICGLRPSYFTKIWLLFMPENLSDMFNIFLVNYRLSTHHLTSCLIVFMYCHCFVQILSVHNYLWIFSLLHVNVQYRFLAIFIIFLLYIFFVQYSNLYSFLCRNITVNVINKCCSCWTAAVTA